MANTPPLASPEKKFNNQKALSEPQKPSSWIGKVKEEFKPRKFFNLKMASLWMDDESEFFRVTYMPVPEMKELGAMSYWVIVNLKTGNINKTKEICIQKEKKSNE